MILVSPSFGFVHPGEKLPRDIIPGILSRGLALLVLVYHIFLSALSNLRKEKPEFFHSGFSAYLYPWRISSFLFKISSEYSSFSTCSNPSRAMVSEKRSPFFPCSLKRRIAFSMIERASSLEVKILLSVFPTAVFLPQRPPI